jgi:hypothetical protein
LLVRRLLNPLRGSPKAIATSLLEQTPTGSSRQDVLGWVDSQGLREGGRPWSLNEPKPLQRQVGEYDEFGFTTLVFAHWIFDNDGRLERIEVWKWVSNAP